MGTSSPTAGTGSPPTPAPSDERAWWQAHLRRSRHPRRAVTLALHRVALDWMAPSAAEDGAIDLDELDEIVGPSVERAVEAAMLALEDSLGQAFDSIHPVTASRVGSLHARAPLGYE